MLHEILLALLGYTGDLIVDRRDISVSLHSDEESTFILAPDISFLQPGESSGTWIVALGFLYRELDRFATESRNLGWIIRSNDASPLTAVSELSRGKSRRQSVYRRAVANGIVEVLSVYRSAILHVEQRLLAETVPILATVIQGLNKFFVLFPALHKLIVQIERNDVRGGQLLDLLHERSHCGVPELQTCIQRCVGLPALIKIVE